MLLFTLCSQYICQHCHIHISKLTLLQVLSKVLANSATKSIKILAESWLTFLLSITNSLEQIALILALTFAIFLYLLIGGFMRTVSVYSLFSYVEASSSLKKTFSKWRINNTSLLYV